MKTIRALPNVLKVFLALGLWRALRQIWAIAKWVRQEILASRYPINLLQRYAGMNACWAVVLGERGLSEAMCHQLARRGFHVLIIAADQTVGSILAQNLRTQHGIETACVTCDLAHVGQSDESCKRLLRVIDQATGGGDIGMLVLSVGASDLAMHFTDKTLRENRKMVNMSVLGTLSLVQSFLPIFVRRPCRSAIITFGSITSRLGGTPGLAVASGNKSFVRAFSRAISKEFEDHVDVLCAHPLGVKESIVRGKTISCYLRPFLVSADDFANGVLSHLGQTPPTRETAGTTLQETISRLWAYIEPLDLHVLRSAGRISALSKLLDRPIDNRPIYTKLVTKQ